MSDVVKITADKKTSIITIQAHSSSPELAARLANSFLKPFRTYLNSLLIEEALARRDFFAQQIEINAQRPFRDPTIQSALLSGMVRQYETARLDQAKESLILLQLDIAQKPEKKSGPKRAQLTLLVGSFSFLFMLLLVIFKRLLLHLKKDSNYSQKIILIKKAWRLIS